MLIRNGLVKSLIQPINVPPRMSVQTNPALLARGLFIAADGRPHSQCHEACPNRRGST